MNLTLVLTNLNMDISSRNVIFRTDSVFQRVIRQGWLWYTKYPQTKLGIQSLPSLDSSRKNTGIWIVAGILVYWQERYFVVGWYYKTYESSHSICGVYAYAHLAPKRLALTEDIWGKTSYTHQGRALYYHILYLTVHQTKPNGRNWRVSWVS